MLFLLNKHNMIPEEERAHGTISNKMNFLFAKEGSRSHFITIAFIVLLLVVEVSTTTFSYSFNVVFIRDQL